MKFTYRPRGVCSQLMEIETEDGRIKSFSVMGGCDGNLKGIAKLIEGMEGIEAVFIARDRTVTGTSGVKYEWIEQAK